MKELHIGHGFRFPLDVATQTPLIFGKRGSGKSSTATRLAEQLIDARVPIAVLDPVDVWWGLKAGADGQPEGGKQVYVFGGRHADMPLEPTAGELMADLIVDNHVNTIMVLRQFSNREKAKFVAAFAERLFQLNTEVLHLIAEEAHELMPQQPYGGEEEMLGRMLRLHKLGRNAGIGLTSVTQRAASLNKNATTQSEILICHRLVGPQDVEATKEWIKYHRVQEQKDLVLESLHELKTGEAWVWAPSFPEDDPIGLQRVKVLMPETFDSRRTPKPGEKRAEPKQLAPVDLEKLGQKMAATRERAKQEDPRFLRQQIAQLKSDLARKPQISVPNPVREEVRVAVLKDGHLHRLEAATTRFEKAKEQAAGILASASAAVTDAAAHVRAALSEAKSIAANGAKPRSLVAAPSVAPVQRSPVYRPRPVPSAAKPREDQAPLSKQARAMLEEMARRHPVRLTRSQLATLSGYSTRSSQFGPAVRDLMASGFIQITAGEYEITESGIAEAGVQTNVPLSPEETYAMWIQKLPVQPAAFFRILWEAGPKGMSLEELAERSYYSMASSQFRPSLNTLVRNGLVEIEGNAVRVSDTLIGVGV